MALIVEDGTGRADAESYVSVAACNAYAVARGLSFPMTDVAACEAALRRATAWLDNGYRSAFPGLKRNGREQALEWPRSGVTDQDGYAVPYDSLPVEMVNACCEVAVRELASPNSMISTSAGSEGAVSRVKVDVLEIEYQNSVATQSTSDQVADLVSSMLSGLIGSMLGGYTMRAARG